MTMETEYFEMALEYVFQRPYPEIADRARRGGDCDESDLHAMGWAIYQDLVRLARGDISRISIPPRLPRRGEFEIGD